MYRDEYYPEPPIDPPDDNACWVCDHECDLDECLIADTSDFVSECPEWIRVMKGYE